MNTIASQRLLLRVDPSGRVQVGRDRRIAPPPEASQARTVKPRRRAQLLTFGAVTIRLYPSSWYSKTHRKKYHAYTLAWRDLSGTRKREKRSNLDLAKKRAAEIAEAIQTGEALLGQFSQSDRACLARARELLAPIGSPAVEVICGTHAQLVLDLRGAGFGHVTPEEAIKFFLEHQPRGVTPRTIPQLVEDLLAEKRQHKRGSKWLATLEQQLSRFAGKFTGHLQSLSGHEISAWLDGLRDKHGKPHSLWTRANYRAAVRELVRFAQAKSQLSKAWDELAHVEDPEPQPVEVDIYTPDQLKALLSNTHDNMLPFTALTAFAGVRHEEMSSRDPSKPVLDWKDIRLDRRIIKIRSNVAKIKKRRVIPMHPNLAAWLRPFAKAEGRICPLENPSNALVKAKRRAGLPSGRGELTNALRASFISHRLAETADVAKVAYEAGNSPQIIAANYLELVEPEDARRYFNLFPSQPEMLVLEQDVA